MNNNIIAIMIITVLTLIVSSCGTSSKDSATGTGTTSSVTSTKTTSTLPSKISSDAR